ncbi:MAG: response regulator transcription factor [Melioribacteraceae bacterium]|nr:response regulator transcription factor [Melioribacteraceae bacterium]
MSKDYTFLLADDHALIKTAYKQFLSKVDNYYVVGEVETGTDLIKKYFDCKPDLMIADISMPDKTGINAFLEIKEKDPDAKALFISVNDKPEDVFEVFSIGGSGLLNKNIEEDTFLLAVKKALSGDTYFSGFKDKTELNKFISKYMSISKISSIPVDIYKIKLNDKEMKLLRFLACGLTSKEIGEHLNTKEKTVEIYRSKLRSKLDLAKGINFQTFAVDYLEKVKKSKP